MGWVRHADPDRHRCPVPTVGAFGAPAGEVGDLWRCGDCRTLWRIGLVCGWCDTRGIHEHPGGHAIGRAWRRAGIWQRLRYWRRG